MLIACNSAICNYANMVNKVYSEVLILYLFFNWMILLHALIYNLDASHLFCMHKYCAICLFGFAHLMLMN